MVAGVLAEWCCCWPTYLVTQIRHYAAGSNLNGGVHFIGMEVFALDVGTSMAQSCKPY